MANLLAYGKDIMGVTVPQLYHTFSIATTDWTANTDPSTSTRYPYVAAVATTLFTDSSHPVWQMNGVGELPTDVEADEIAKVQDLIASSSGLTLYATDEVVAALVLEVGGEGGNSEQIYASGVSFDNTTSGLTATDVQSAIDEVYSLITPASEFYELTESTGAGSATQCTIKKNGVTLKILINTGATTYADVLINVSYSAGWIFKANVNITADGVPVSADGTIFTINAYAAVTKTARIVAQQQ